MICPSAKSCVTPGGKMPKCVLLSSAVSGPEWPATQITLPTLSSLSCASCAKRRIGPYFRYENEPYVEHAPQYPAKSAYGSWWKFTVARPHTIPEFENSVICCGRSAPSSFLPRLYQPKPFTSP